MSSGRHVSSCMSALRTAMFSLFSLLACGCALAHTSLTVVSAADYWTPVACDSIVSIFGPGIATGVFMAQDPPPAPLPLTLGGVSAVLSDPASPVDVPVQLIAVTPSQVNALLPCSPFLVSGSVPIHLTASDGHTLSGMVSFARVTLSLFTADESGQGVPAGQVVIGHADGSQTFVSSIAQCTSKGCTPVPIDIGASTDEVVLELFGTGIRNVNPAISYPAPPVTATVSKSAPPGWTPFADLPVLYAGPQGAGSPGSYFGLDQVNVSLPHSLAGSGRVALYLSAPGQFFAGTLEELSSNIVIVDIK